MSAFLPAQPALLPSEDRLSLSEPFPCSGISLLTEQNWLEMRECGGERRKEELSFSLRFLHPKPTVLLPDDGNLSPLPSPPLALWPRNNQTLSSCLPPRQGVS